MTTTELRRERTRWECGFCGQTVMFDVDGTPWLPPGFLKNCQLREHLIGYECIAFRDTERAAQLIAKYEYDEEVFIDEGRDVVFSWLRAGRGVPPVRVEMSREFLGDNWGIKWSDKAAVKAEFKLRRMAYLEPASKAAGGSERDFRVYKVYTQ
jgi:hypothetical protein